MERILQLKRIFGLWFPSTRQKGSANFLSRTDCLARMSGGGSSIWVRRFWVLLQHIFFSHSRDVLFYDNFNKHKLRMHLVAYSGHIALKWLHRKLIFGLELWGCMTRCQFNCGKERKRRAPNLYLMSGWRPRRYDDKQSIFCWWVWVRCIFGRGIIELCRWWWFIGLRGRNNICGLCNGIWCRREFPSLSWFFWQGLCGTAWNIRRSMTQGLLRNTFYSLLKLYSFIYQRFNIILVNWAKI